MYTPLVIRHNPILRSDAYKFTHPLQLPPGTKKMLAYLESRGGEYDKILWSGLQGLLKYHLMTWKFEHWMVDDAAGVCEKVFGTDYYFQKKMFKKLADRGGAPPLRIKAAPEGLLIPTHNMLMSIVNTDDEMASQTCFWESLLLHVWETAIVGTKSYHVKLEIDKWAKKSGTRVNPFHLNDFGLRGASSLETAIFGGIAHLMIFLGTDNMPAIDIGRQLYAGLMGHSVFATEHSTTTVWKYNGEERAFRHFLSQLPDHLIGSIVVDSYDMYAAIKMLGTVFREQILKRKGRIVVRPDSGNPPQVSLEVLRMLAHLFGHTTNKAGYTELPWQVGSIYGDGINLTSIRDICQNIVDVGKFSMNNQIFGSGGWLIQQATRDTPQMAIKCMASQDENGWFDVWKNPVGDPSKQSKRGEQKLIHDEFLGYMTVPASDPRPDIMRVVYEDGNLLVDESAATIRARVDEAFV